MVIRIALLTDDSYTTITLASMLLDVGYQLVPDLHHTDIIITDQSHYLSVDKPIIFLYEVKQPKHKRTSTLPCRFLEKPVNIQDILHAIDEVIPKTKKEEQNKS